MNNFYRILDVIDDFGFGVFMAHRKVNKSEALHLDLRCKIRWGAVWLAHHNGNTNDYWRLLLKVLVPDYGFDKAMTVLAGYWDSTHAPDKLQKPAR